MRKKYRNAVWEGRFQPIHVGHIQYIKKMLTLAEKVWIIVLANETYESASLHVDLISPEFTKEVDGHHRSEKNPFPLWLRLLLVQQTLKAELSLEESSRVVIGCGHRLDLDPLFYKKHLLPRDRVFLTPTRDLYEDSKADFWEKFGEECIRVDVSEFPAVSATQVREAINGNDRELLSKLLAPTAIKLLEEYNYIKPSPSKNTTDIWHNRRAKPQSDFADSSELRPKL